MIKSKYLIIIATIALFLGAGVGASGFLQQTATSGTAPGMTADASYQASGIEPNPVMNTNITWSTFYNGWNPLEYNNGSANQTLSTNYSTFYKNPITVVPQNIVSPAFKGKIGSVAWNNSANWYNAGSGTPTSSNGKIYLNISSTDTQQLIGNIYLNLSLSDLPSQNMEYDYLTILGTVTQSSQTTGDGFFISIQNGSTVTTIYGPNVNNETTVGTTSNHYLPNSYYMSFPMSEIITNAPSGYVLLRLYSYVPETTTNGTANVNLTITGMSVTTTQETLGTSGNGKVTAALGPAHLSSFNPDFAWSEIANGGYSVATSQPIQNISTSQSSINEGNYIEQATYQGTLSLPTAPDLTYNNTNITMSVSLPGSQFVVTNLNGVSYTTTLSGMKNGTLAFGSVNPNNANTIVLEVDYTASQWNSVSNAPSFWTNPIGTIEYYWYISLGILLGAIGLGAGMSSRSEAFRGVKK